MRPVRSIAVCFVLLLVVVFTLPNFFVSSAFSSAILPSKTSSVNIYVANGRSSTVSVIRGTQVIANVNVSSGQCCQMAYDSHDGKLFVPLENGNVSVINVKTEKVIDTITGASGDEIQYVSKNGEVYVTTSYGYGDTVYVINAKNDQVITSISLGHRKCTLSIGYSPANNELYVGSYGQDAGSYLLFVINPMTNKIVKIIHMPEIDAASMSYDPANKDMYITAGNTELDVLVYNTKNELVANITNINEYPALGEQLAYNPSNRDMYLTGGYFENVVYVISSNTKTIVGTISGFSEPTGIAFDSSNQLMYIANYNNGTVQTVKGLDVINTIALGTSEPDAIVMT